jgi:ligand-binding sensor domain-containing protein/DNA-binding CsgD family transcriptional regulator
MSVNYIIGSLLKRISIVIIISLCSEIPSFSQIKDIGTPFIRNFSKTDYKAGTQIWSVAQDLKGFMYFANNEGLLIFDGVRWELLQLPGFSIIRSLYIDYRGVIYIGAYNEIGKVVPGADGKLNYVSLKDLIPSAYRNFDDVWSICPYDGKIVFQSYNALYIFDEKNEVSVIPAESRFTFSYNISGRLIVIDESGGLLELSGSGLKHIEGFEKLQGSEISSILPFDENSGQLLICTITKGLFLYNGSVLNEWKHPANNLLIKRQIFSATTLQKDFFAIGTIQDGLIIIDKNGNLVQHIDKDKGLQNNTILRVFSDRSGNLWLGLDNGIDYVNISSPVTFLQNPDGFGAGYTELIHNGKLYLGTNQGLYVSDWSDGKIEGDFSMVPGTIGQVWYLGVHRGKVICGHNYGTYLIEGEEAILISDIPGGWKYHIHSKYPDHLIGGTYSGLILFKWEKGTWNFVRRIPGFSESFRVFEEDENGDLWMSHGFKGIYRIRINEDLDSVIASRHYTKKDGLPSDFTLNVFKLKGRIIFTADTTGIYEYIPQQDTFQLSPYFNQLVAPVRGITYLKEDPMGNIWYVSYGRIGLFRIREDFSFTHITSPFTLLAGKLIHGFESVYTYPNNQVLISFEDGFAHYSPHDSYRIYTEFSTYITRIEADYIDTVFYPVNLPANTDRRSSVINLPHKGNQLRFYYSAPVYDNQLNIEYCYKIEGFDEKWSRWSNNFYQDINNLPNGHFIFTVKARNPLGIESISDSLGFVVLPPWYKTTFAYISYILILVSFFLTAGWFVHLRIGIYKRRESLRQLREYNDKEREYIRQALVSEKEIITMKNEKLQSEKRLRDKELANQAMNIIRKNETLSNIKKELTDLKKYCHDPGINEKLSLIISRINRDAGQNKQREVFDKAFDEVHEAFLEKLKSQYPSLTPTELRVCAFLKMNISTKEIAPLMNISVRGVEICRYRIRKKIKIGRDINLTGFLINL